MDTLQKIQAAVRVECDRQKVGERQRRSLYETYLVHRFHHDVEMTTSRLREIAYQIECPVLGCGDIHRIPVDIQFAYGVSESGSIDITIFPPVPDISRMADHLAYEHGVF